MNNPFKKAITNSRGTCVVPGVDMGGDLISKPIRVRKEAIRQAILELFDDPEFVDQIQWKLALHEDKPKKSSTEHQA